MTIEEMNKLLTKINSQSFETKILNVMLTQYSEIKSLEKQVKELQQKVNEIITNWNTEIEGQNAEALNNDIQEDEIEVDLVDEDTGAADFQEVK